MAVTRWLSLDTPILPMRIIQLHIDMNNAHIHIITATGVLSPAFRAYTACVRQRLLRADHFDTMADVMVSLTVSTLVHSATSSVCMEVDVVCI